MPGSESRMSTVPERGIDITTPELATEGTATVLDAIARTGATAITTTTSVVVPADEETDLREPPLDVAGHRRVLDRPIWGRDATWVRRYVAHPPDPDLWRDLPWPSPPLAPEGFRVDHAREAIDGARERGLRVYAHFAPYALPGGSDHREGMPTNAELRLRYRPVRFIGGIHPEGISWVGCLNNPTVRHYGRVRLTELLRHYGDVDGLALEWVEYPAYFLEKLFTCFCDHCRDQALALGYDWDQITGAVRILWDSLHTLTQDQIAAIVGTGDWGDLVPDPEAMRPGFAAWLDFKAASVRLAIEDLRGTMADLGAGDMAISTIAPAVPWGRMSGGAYARAGHGVDTQRVKLYSAHWLMMSCWWTQTLLTWNRGSTLTSDMATRAVMALFGIHFEHEPATLAPELCTMPSPGESHNLTPESFTHRLENALTLRTDQAPILPTIHAYRPADELARLLETIRPFAGHGLWIHRYGYLSDEKLDLLRQEWSRS
jgi:hypothetical protein